MRKMFNRKTTAFALAMKGFVLGSLMVGGVFAQSPTPPPTFKSQEQNLDANGFIRVHEQGVLKANVQVDNFPTSIGVNNFPKTQDVNVVGGQVLAYVPPVTTGYSDFLTAGPGETYTVTLPAPINASTIAISKRGEGAIYFTSPLSLGGGEFRPIRSVFHIDDDADKVTFVNHSFIRPVPIDAIVYRCTNEQSLCLFSIDIVGDPGV